MSKTKLQIEAQQEYYGENFIEVLNTFRQEVSEHTDSLINYFNEKPYAPGEEELSDILKHLHTLKGITAQNGLTDISKEIHQIEEVFVSLKRKQFQFIEGSYESLVDYLSTLEDLIGNLIGETEEAQLDRLEKILSSQYRAFRRLYGIFSHGISDSQKQKFKATLVDGFLKRETQNEKSEIRAILNDKKYTINESTLDQLTAYLSYSIIDVPDEHRSSNATLHTISMIEKALQELDTLKKVSLKPLEQKIRVMAMNLSNRLGKEVQIVFNHFDTSVDESWFSTLSEVLLHLVRNSIDHGIESKQARLQNSKKPKATITISVVAKQDRIALQITDDGAGIDPQKIQQIALAKGIMTETVANSLSTQEMQEIIFMPGFSSKEQANDISGRGVGMDVVLHAVESKGGSIELSSEVGQGTRFEIKFSNSCYYNEVQVIRFDDSFYSINKDFIAGMFEPHQIKSCTDGKVTLVDETVLPVLHLSEIDFEEQDVSRSVVILSVEDNTCAVFVDEVIGSEKLFFLNVPNRTGSDSSCIKTISCGFKLGRVYDIDRIFLEKEIAKLRQNKLEPSYTTQQYDDAFPLESSYFKEESVADYISNALLETEIDFGAEKNLETIESLLDHICSAYSGYKTKEELLDVMIDFLEPAPFLTVNEKLQVIESIIASVEIFRGRKFQVA